MIVKFQFVIYCYVQYFKFFSYWDIGVFIFEIKCGIRFFYYNGLIFRIVFFQIIFIILFINKFQIRVNSIFNFFVVIMSKENLCVVCVVREFVFFYDEQEIVDEDIKY